MTGWTLAPPTLMTPTVLIVLVVLIILIGLTGHSLVNARLLRRPSTAPSVVEGPVSVLLPVRDEAHQVGACLDALLRQRGVPGLRIEVLDDGSTDGTAEVVRAVAAADARVSLHTGTPLPHGWLGKPYACHQLAALAKDTAQDTAQNPARAPVQPARVEASQQVLVFVDADVILAPDAVAAAVGLLDGFDLVCPYPRIVTRGLGERLVQPLLQWSWLTFLPLRAMERSARPSLAAAGGQFLLLTRCGYDRAGGHAAVRDEVLEDIGLARAVKRTGGRIALADGSRLASCHMYATWPALVAGYTKSLWASFGSPVAAAAVVGVLLLLYAVPAPLAVIAAGLGAWPVAVAGGLGYLLGVGGRVVAARATGSRAWPDALAQPVSMVLFAWLVVRSYRRRHTATWKGRRVRPR